MLQLTQRATTPLLLLLVVHHAGPYLAVVSRSTMLGTGPRKSRFYRVDRVDLLRFRPASRLAADAQRDERK